ncbi:unnamed protein product, partial [Brenthis ino]
MYFLLHSTFFVNCLGGVEPNMYDCIPGGPEFKSRVEPSLVIESFCICGSVTARSWEVGGILLPCLGEYVKASVLRLNSHQSCRVVVPPEYGRRGRNRSGGQ